jgi:ribonuclease P protein component
MPNPNSLPKKERLHQEKIIAEIFSSGKSLAKYPIRAVFSIPEAGSLPEKVAVAFAVSKKKFKTSVARHRIRRLMFEAYRLQKQEWYATLPNELPHLALMLLYTASEEVPIDKIKDSWRKLYIEISKSLDPSPKPPE